MTISSSELLRAFDRAIGQVTRLQREGLETAAGRPAVEELARLRADLEAHRAQANRGDAFDRDWAGGVVRWMAEWLPDSELPLLAALGAIVRAAPRA